MQRYNLDELKKLNIKDVVLALGAEETTNHKMVKCFNKDAHSHGDKRASMKVKEDSNTCFCYACGASGDPINAAKVAFGNNFQSACEWLHDTFHVAYLDGSVNNHNKPKYEKPKIKPIKWVTFDKNHFYYNVKINDFIEKYANLTDSQKVKMVYTFVYRYSLKTSQDAKLAFYRSRGIETHQLIDTIGFLSKEDLKDLLPLLEKYFPLEDLIKFKLYNESSAKYFPLSWKYGDNLTVVPSFDLYTDMANGLMLRPIQKRNWGPKEYQVSCLDLVDAYPFAMNYNMFLDDNIQEIYFCEGHIDGLSLGDKVFVAIPGIHSYKKEWLSLFRNKKCVIIFDQDDAGIKGTDILRENLISAGVENVNILDWNPDLGNDINELLQKGLLKKVLP